MLDRRAFLRAAGLGAAGSLAVACTPIYRELAGDPAEPGDFTETPHSDFRALSRMTFGARFVDRQFVRMHGLSAWIEEQLDPDNIDDSSVEWRLRSLESLKLPPKDVETWEEDDVVAELSQSAILRATYSNRQLFEVMVRFWSDHFNISVEKGECWLLKPTDEREVIRPHTFGRFEELLGASAHSPAMLVYLDNQANIWEAPNENYAREVLELHTLGVEGGYSQDDVMELARMLTGWRVKEHFWKGEFTFEEDWHDPGLKTFMGDGISPADIREAEAVLLSLANAPSTARHISIKLIRRFVCDDPEHEARELIERAARTFLETRGDIQQVVRLILLDGLSSLPETRLPKFKRPFEYVVSALRLLGADTDGGAPIQDYLRAMGQPLYAWPTPDGPADDASAWVTNLLPRWNFALDLVDGNLEGTEFHPRDFVRSLLDDPSDDSLDRLSHLLIGEGPNQRISDIKFAHLRAGDEEDLVDEAAFLTAAVLLSPEFQWRG